MTFDQLRKSILVRGESPGGKTWDRAWRAHLVENLQVLVGNLWSVEVYEIFINGSFVEEKDHPNDIDGYFECEAEGFSKLHSSLKKIDACWTWDHRERRPYHGSPKLQLPMWHKYRVELYPHFRKVMSGIPDEFGNDQPFPAAFRKTRGSPRKSKGIVKIIREAVNES